MSITKRIISTLLAVLMLVGACTFVVSAEDDTTTTRPAYTKNTTSAQPTYWYFTGHSAVKNDKDEWVEDKNSDVLVNSAQDKLALMDLRYEKDGYRLYVDAYSGEVATECIATGEILFSNPYNIKDSVAKPTIKAELMSQLIVSFKDITSDKIIDYNSYEWCASRGQTVVKTIKNGVRVEYSIGREEAKMLVPQLIKKESFEAIVSTIEQAYIEAGKEIDWAFDFVKIFDGWYKLYDPSTVKSDAELAKMNQSQKITKKGIAVYALDTTATTKEKARIEQCIKQYCPSYTYEQLDEDHMEVEFVPKDENAPLFKMALEYTLDKDGMSVRLPANGIRFNESLYRLENIVILPYMGAGMSPNEGYTFFPDGSGALFDFETLYALGVDTNKAGKVYGDTDYAYHTITATHQEVIRYPVFGLVEKETLTEIIETEEEGTEDTELSDSSSAQIKPVAAEDEEPETFTYVKDRGFVAIVEEGDALMNISTVHRASVSDYHTLQIKVDPRPKDSYNVGDSISVGSNASWEVVSARKYTGSYKIRYVMLTDDDVAKDAGVSDYYECSYMGMANAYRNYLEEKGILTRLTDNDVSKDIPLYIESFGAMETLERVLSIPVSVMTPLTTFEDISSMYDELSEQGITNINFIMTGFTDGGITYPTVPYKLKWEKSVSKEMDFEELVQDAAENGYKLFPDFDFAFASTNTLFDGLTLKKHAVKTIDGRYTSKREYSSTKQTFLSFFELAISPAYFNHFYEKLTKQYSEYNVNSIAVTTLGTYLNSDFDEDEPYNREDAKEFTIKAFEHFTEKYDNILSESGNAFTWRYVDYLTDIALDSSRYSVASASVPFLGIVLHGYVELAGTPINMEGNIDYAFLKAIENGASMKFILSYRNTENLKEDYVLNKYYSIDYAIWEAELVERYNELNALLKGVQTSIITKHQFVDTASRIPDNSELKADATEAIEAAIAYEKQVIEDAEIARREALKNARKDILAIYDTLYNDADTKVSGSSAFYVNFLSTAMMTSYEATIEALKEAIKTGEGVEEAANAAKNSLATIFNTAKPIIAKATANAEAYENAMENYEFIVSENAYKEDVRAKLKSELDRTEQYYEKMKDFVADTTAITDKAYKALVELLPNDEEIKPFDTTVEDEVVEDETTTEEVEGEEYYVDPKYAVDNNKIVYEEYENGTAFLLNFNNYSVSVKLPVNGITYTVEPYGYIVVAMAS